MLVVGARPVRFMMTSRFYSIGCVLWLGLLVAASGCGDGRPSRVPVSGTVLIDGKPLTTGSVMFVHPDSRPSSGMIGSDGHFQLSCFEIGDGAVPGKHRVQVTASQAIDERSNRWFAPKKYTDTNTSGLEVEITEPRDDLKIELTWAGSGQKGPFVDRF
jgi:hypothetical protein